MSSALEDIIIVLDWLAATKTPTNAVASAMERLKKRSHIPEEAKEEIRRGPVVTINEDDEPHKPFNFNE